MLLWKVNDKTERRFVMGRARTVLELFAACLVYSLIVIIIDCVIVLVFQRDLGSITYLVSFVMIIEGGLSLAVGGAIASFSTPIGKISETILHSKPWDAKRLREAEKTARTWIVTGLFLFLFGLAVSAF